MAPGFSATSYFQVFERYAEALREVGVAVLLFDFRGFGLSDGEPRYEINPWTQARDYLAAVEYVRRLDSVDSRRVGVWGVSLSAAIAATVAAADPEIAAVVLQVPAFGDVRSAPDSDGSLFRQIRSTVLDADLDSFDRTVEGPLPVVSASQLSSPSFVRPPSAFRWFIDSGGRFGTRWENHVTISRFTTPAPFDAQVCVPHIAAPTLMVIAEEEDMEGADADVARDVFRTASEPKQLLTVDGGHFGVLYRDSPEFELSASTQQRFLQEHLLG
jgi:pimeloyl-ACP methyl ester carboxylesterase